MRDQIPSLAVYSNGMHQHGSGIESAQLMQPEHFLSGSFVRAFAQVNHEGRAVRGRLELLAHIGGKLQRVRPTGVLDDLNREVFIEHPVIGIVMAYRGRATKQIAQSAP